MRVVIALFRGVAAVHARAWLALALLAGVFGGAALGAASGAHRTGTAVDRFNERTRPPHVFFAPTFTLRAGPDVMARFASDQVRDWSPVRDLAPINLIANERVEIARRDGTWRPLDAAVDVNHMVDPRVGRSLFGVNVIAGRQANPDVPNEVMVNEIAYRELGLRPGTRVRVHTTDGFFGEAPPKAAGTMDLTVVGVGASVSDFASGATAGLAISAASVPPQGAATAEIQLIWLRAGDAGLDDFRSEIERRTDGQPALFVEGRAVYDQGRRSVGLQATALWMLVGFLALLTAMIFGQSLARQTFVESDSNATLHALGITRGQLFGFGMVRAAIIAIGAVVVSVAVAVALSPFFPIGNGRLIEIDPGFSASPRVLVIGAGITMLTVVVLALVPAWRTGAARAEARLEQQRPSAIAGAAARTARRPSAIAGIRMALEAGRGRTAVPVRTTIAGSVLGILALVAAMIAGSNLDRLVVTPPQYGWTWDVVAYAEDFDAKTRARLESVEGVADVSYGMLGGAFILDDVTTEGIVMDPGPVEMPILEGRAPSAADEIAVGRKTLRAVGAKVGDLIDFTIQGVDASKKVRVTGVTVLPLASDSAALGEGVWATMGFVRGLIPEMPYERAFVRFDPAQRDSAEAALKQMLGADSFEGPIPPSAVVDFGRVRSMPWMLAGVVAALAAATLAHGLVTSVRRRRRDLAILKTLGFTKGQVRGAVAWQASVLSLVALAFALPLGVGLGRWTWTAFAARTGFVADPRIDLRLLLVIPVTVVLANLLSMLPGRSAATTQPATTLRAE